MKRRDQTSAAVVLALCLALAACTDRDTKLARLSSYLSSGLEAAISTQLVLSRDKIITGKEDRALGEAILKLNSAGKQFNEWLIVYRDNKSRADMNELQKLLALIQSGSTAVVASIHVKSPEAQQRLELISKTINLALTLSIELQKEVQ